MKKHQLTNELIYHPVWLLMAVVLPQVILFFLIFHSYTVFSSLLTEDQAYLWSQFGIAFSLLILTVFVYAIWLICKKRRVGVLVSPFIFITYIPLLYLYFRNNEDLIHWNVPEWMTSRTDLVLLYPGTFLMPAFIYALMIAIFKMTPSNAKNRPILNFLGAVLIPLGWYGFFTLIAPMFRNILRNISEHVVTVLAVSSTLAFFFFLFRCFFILFRKSYNKSIRFNYAWRFVFSMVLPLTGLIAYQWVLPSYDSMIHREAQSIIGDFNHSLFWAITLVNGSALSFPDLKGKISRSILFGFRVLCFPYTIYFCLVFLPFLPLSVMMVLIFGLGLLMLAPIFLFIIQSKVLINDYQILCGYFSRYRVAIGLLAVLLILPAGVSLHFYLDRFALHNALDYVFTDNQKVDVDRNRLRKVLNTLKAKQKKTPFISPYYQWLVLDNLRLSKTRILALEKIFFNKSNERASQKPDEQGDPSVVVSNIQSRTVWEEQSSSYRSYIDLELTNQGLTQAEYATGFTLPAGVWVSDYYLLVGEEKARGRLMEKKAALWVYNRIKAQRKDPGLIYYVNENRLVLRVFPLNGRQVRKTGFELVHKEPFFLIFDNQVINLGRGQIKNRKAAAPYYPIVSVDGRAIYVSKAAKEQLPLVQRQPYFHFVLDYSDGCEQPSTKYLSRIERLVMKHHLNMNFAKVTFANYAHKTYYWQDSWKKQLAAFPCEGGFFLQKTIKAIFRDQHRARNQVYPVIIVVSPDLSNGILPENMEHYAFATPELDVYYELTGNGDLVTHDLVSNPQPAAFGRIKPKVRVWPAQNNPKVFFRDDGKPALALIQENFALDRPGKAIDQWQQGLVLWGLTKKRLFDRKVKEDWTHLVQLSKEYNLLHAFTAFTVLENQAQWEVLKRKERTALGGKKSMTLNDGNQDFNQMTEPSLLLVMFVLLVLLGSIKTNWRNPWRC